MQETESIVSAAARFLCFLLCVSVANFLIRLNKLH
jgi:hypothetical protein